jgi:oxygen-independent coproporphyrinogen III oxidase
VSLGVYFHIPFCQSKCLYCHFISAPYRSEIAEKYHQSVLKELASCSSNDEKVDSIYFGGGTPSIVPTHQISQLISASRKCFSVTEGCEISLEANPDAITEAKASAFLDSGVTRISLGAQSFDDGELAAIGRSHNADMIFETLHSLKKKGFLNINLDLMLGLPRQTPDSWRTNLRKIVELSIPHVSVYMLDLDDQCPLRSLVANGSIQIPDEDLVSDLYLETIDFLSSHGYQQYEISNFARPGFNCRHNLKYWTRQPVRGFGLGSHSFDGTRRYANNSEMDGYIHSIENGDSPVAWSELVSDSQALEETLFLGLRLNRGIDWGIIRERCTYERRADFEVSFDKLASWGWIEWNDSVVRLTQQGMLFSNEVFQLFI